MQGGPSTAAYETGVINKTSQLKRFAKNWAAQNMANKLSRWIDNQGGSLLADPGPPGGLRGDMGLAPQHSETFRGREEAGEHWAPEL